MIKFISEFPDKFYGHLEKIEKIKKYKKSEKYKKLLQKKNHLKRVIYYIYLLIYLKN